MIGQIVIFCNLILLGILLFPLCRDSWREKETHTIRLIVITVMAILPLVLLGLMVCGYFYTTLRLLVRWVESLYLLQVWNLVYLTTIHGLSVAARRQNLNKEGAEGSESAPEPPLALDQIGQQSLRLTTMVLLLIFSGVLYWIWSDLVRFGHGDVLPGQHYAVALQRDRGGQRRIAGGDAGQSDGLC